MAADIFDDIINALEVLKKKGQKEIYLSEKAKETLFHDESFDPREAPTQGYESSIHAELKTATAESQKPATKTPEPKQDDNSSATDEADSRSWEEIQQAVSECTLCPLNKTRTHAVFGEGDSSASVMFIGEGPGYYEDQSGRPFVGRAGQLLTKMIKAMQFEREEVFITNVVKCRPPGNRNPEEQEVRTCNPYLNRQIDLIQPSVIVLLGAVPLLHLLGEKGITKIHGSWFKYRGVPTLPTFHPSFLLRSPKKKTEAWEDLQKVMRHVGKDPNLTVAQKQE